jgi:purine nucleosidase
MISVTKRLVAAALLLVSIAATDISYGDNHSSAAPRTDASVPGAPINVIFDTDMWSDIDDALALAMLHALRARDEINLLAVTVSTDEKWCAPYVDLVNTFYGRSDIHVGVVHDGLNVDAFRNKYPDMSWPVTRYTEALSERKKKNGSLVYPHRLLDGSKAQDAVVLLRQTLAQQPDASVVMIQVGYSTNLARLLDGGADAASARTGRDLVRHKVRLLSVMAGNFGESMVDGKVLPRGSPEFNVASDVPSAQKLFSGWPTPIVASGFEIGLAMLYPASSIERDFSYVDNHPIAETYRTFAKERKVPNWWPHDHATFDLTSVLYAARPDRNYFSLSKPGTIAVLADGSSHFDESAAGMHRFLILSEDQKARALEAMVMLTSQPPINSAAP